ncbi:hypothetical protein WDW89_25160 [Deltaproteobacteria bacterium TL4]
MNSFIAFPISSELSGRLSEALKNVRLDPPEKKHTDLVLGVVIDMTDAGIEFYYEGLTNRFGLTGWGVKIVSGAMKTVKGGLHMMIRKVAKGLSNEQFHPLMGFLEELHLEQNEKSYVAFPISNKLGENLKKAVQLIKTEPGKKENMPFIIEVVIELSDAGLEFFFLEGARRLEVGNWGTKTMNFGTMIASKAVHSMINSLVPSLQEHQFEALTVFVEEILFQV